MKHCTTFWILLAFALCGCSNATRSPSGFLPQLSTADRLEVTNRYYAFGTTITGTDVRSLTTALTSAKKKTWGAGMDWTSPQSWDIEVYAGTNRLAGFPVCYGVFKIGGVEYSDGSGAAVVFWKKLETMRTTPDTGLEPPASAQ